MLVQASSGGKKTLKIVQEEWSNISISAAGYRTQNITQITGYTFVSADIAAIEGYSGPKQLTLDYVSPSRVDIGGSPSYSVDKLYAKLYYLSDDFEVITS